MVSKLCHSQFQALKKKIVLKRWVRIQRYIAVDFQGWSKMKVSASTCRKNDSKN